LAESRAVIQQAHDGFRDSDVEAISASLAPGFFWITDTDGVYRPDFIAGGAVDLKQFLTSHERLNPLHYDSEFVFGSSSLKNGNITVTTTASEEADHGQLLTTDCFCAEIGGTWKIAGVIAKRKSSPAPLSAASNRNFYWDVGNRPFYSDGK
jgi:hypothetical protein